MSIFVLIAGRIASGKSSLAEGLAAELGWPVAKFSGYLRHLAEQRHMEPSRQLLQALGEELVEADARSFASEFLKFSEWQVSKPIIVDGLRHLEILDAFRSVGRSDQVVLVYVSPPASEAVWEERLKIKDIRSLADLKKIEEHPTERQQPILEAAADIIVSGDRPLHESVSEVVRWMAKT